MKKSKKLSLNRETIRQLSDSRFGVAVGGVPTKGHTCGTFDTCEIRLCLTGVVLTDCVC